MHYHGPVNTVFISHIQGGSGQDPTWSSLVDSLNHIGETKLAGEVEKKHCVLAKEAVKDSTGERVASCPAVQAFCFAYCQLDTEAV